MFKMKMMALLKNKAVKYSIIVLAVIATIVGLIAWPKQDAQQINGGPWKIDNLAYVYQTGNGTKEYDPLRVVGNGGSEYSALFCIQRGAACRSGQQYKNATDISNTISGFFYNNKFDKRNQAAYIINNMYVWNGDSSKNDMLITCFAKKYAPNNVNEVKELAKHNTSNTRNTIGKNVIETVGQLLLWNYTTGEQKETNPANILIDGKKGTAQQQAVLSTIYNNMKSEAEKCTSSDVHKNQWVEYYKEGNKTYKVKTYATIFYNKRDDSTQNLLNVKKDITVEEDKEGKYSIQIHKVDENNENLDSNDIKFTWASANNANDTTWNGGAFAFKKQGSIYTAGPFNIQKNSTNYIKIRETQTKAGYELYDKTIVVEAKTDANCNVTTRLCTETDEKLSVETNLNAGTGAILKLKLKNISGKYSVNLIKVDENGKAIENNPATFLVTGKGTKNGEAKTDAKGNLEVASNQTIDSENETEKYTVEETQAPTGYEKYNGKIEYTVSFKKDNGKLVVDKDKTEKSLNANGTNGTVSVNGNNITITMKNSKKISGKYSIELIKVDENGKVIEKNHAKFDVTGKGTNSPVETGDNGIANIVSNQAISSETATEKYTIKETQAPTGYEKYDGTIEFTVSFKNENNVLTVDKDKTEKSLNANGTNGKISVSGDTIEIKVENPQVFIHKGVKTIENQDSGYYDSETGKIYKNKDEIESTLHDWVIQTKIPGSIKSYDTFKIEDPIDKDKLTFSGLDKVTVKSVDGDQKNDLKKDTDYKISFDENTYKLTISFKDGEFKGGDNLAGKTVEVRFNTTFRKDKDGNIVALNEQVPNQAELLYGNGSDINSKKTETPEVHTGAIGIYKYDRKTNKALVGAHFKIATSKENAQNGIFVKDENGKDLEQITNEQGIAVFTGLEFGEDAYTNAQYKTTDAITGAEVYKYDLSKLKTIYYLVETQSPDGYYQLTEPIEAEVSANKKIDLKDVTSLIQVGNDRIVVHKGVKTIENQDSGYYDDVTGKVYKNKDELESTLHDWVIQTEIPNNISGFTEFQIEDTINDKLVFYGLDSVRAKVIDSGSNGTEQTTTGTDLVKDQDYKVEFEENSKTLTIIFINSEFRGGDNLAGKTVEIRFNTTFAKDENGNVIAINEQVPNQAKLVYSNGGKPFSQVTETPEVHTGAVGIFKYDEKTGKALEGAHFKIATSKENAEQGIFVKDGNGKDIEKITGSNGIAIFTGLEFGGDAYTNAEYKVEENGVIHYKYDLSKLKATYYIVETESPKGYYKLTEPVEAEVSVNKKIDLKDVTSLVNIGNKPQIFDLALRKWVTQAIVTENGNTVVTETGHKAEDDPESVVKVDLKKSKINDVTVKFNYSIRITNQGDVAGYAKEISDYIPQGLMFNQEDNPNWTEKDGKIVTRALENTLLQPGESAEVTVLLTWVNSENNMGVMTNTAEISEDYNEFGLHDIDSTPNNQVEGEDDIDTAPVMLTVKTGSEVIMYSSIALGVLTIITTGVICIKKYVK